MTSPRRCARIFFSIAGLLVAGSAQADNDRAIDHGPIGVMGDHFHKTGEWMLSARVMRMHMSGNQRGYSKLSEAEVLDQPNAPGRMPAVLSVVPNSMDMDMLMLGGMYAPSDTLTLMAMLMASSNDMSLTSFAPPSMMSNAPRSRVGKFSTSSSDIAAVSFSGLIRLKETTEQRTHLTIGLEQSLADANATDTVLTPMGMQMNMRLPYGMQIGDEALRLETALTYVYNAADWKWGGQVNGKFKINAKDWNFGDRQHVTVWGQHSLHTRLSLSGRLSYARSSGLEGNDPMITAPVQTAVPANYGYRQWRVGIGANAIAPLLPGRPERFGIELELPIKTHVSGVQMTPRWQLTVGLQKSF
jgi:hypothetical protein